MLKVNAREIRKCVKTFGIAMNIANKMVFEEGTVRTIALNSVAVSDAFV
jgi:hypothetical protein